MPMYCMGGGKTACLLSAGLQYLEAACMCMWASKVLESVLSCWGEGVESK